MIWSVPCLTTHSTHFTQPVSTADIQRRCTFSSEHALCYRLLNATHVADVIHTWRCRQLIKDARINQSTVAVGVRTQRNAGYCVTHHLAAACHDVTMNSERDETAASKQSNQTTPPANARPRPSPTKWMVTSWDQCAGGVDETGRQRSSQSRLII